MGKASKPEVVKRKYSDEFAKGHKAGYELGMSDGKEIGEENGRRLRKLISPTVFKAAIKRALAEGEAKGRRLERQALSRWGHVDLGENFSRRVIVDQYLDAYRPKRGKAGK